MTLLADLIEKTRQLRAQAARLREQSRQLKAEFEALRRAMRDDYDR